MVTLIPGQPEATAEEKERTSKLFAAMNTIARLMKERPSHSDSLVFVCAGGRHEWCIGGSKTTKDALETAQQMGMGKADAV